MEPHHHQETQQPDPPSGGGRDGNESTANAQAGFWFTSNNMSAHQPGGHQPGAPQLLQGQPLLPPALRVLGPPDGVYMPWQPVQQTPRQSHSTINLEIDPQVGTYPQLNAYPLSGTCPAQQHHQVRLPFDPAKPSHNLPPQPAQRGGRGVRKRSRSGRRRGGEGQNGRRDVNAADPFIKGDYPDPFTPAEQWYARGGVQQTWPTFANDELENLRNVIEEGKKKGAETAQ
jgi:hypothetical protein